MSILGLLLLTCTEPSWWSDGWSSAVRAMQIKLLANNTICNRGGRGDGELTSSAHQLGHTDVPGLSVTGSQTAALMSQ